MEESMANMNIAHKARGTDTSNKLSTKFLLGVLVEWERKSEVHTGVPPAVPAIWQRPCGVCGELMTL